MLFALALMIFCSQSVVAQAPPDRGAEIGVFVGALDLRGSVGEKPFAVGVRGGYRFARWIALEGEFLRCPVDPSGYYGQTMVVGGPKFGWRIRRLGLYGKVRGGVLRIDGPHHRAYNDGRARTEPALDVGFVLLLPLSDHVALRVDGGRTVVFFGNDPMRGPLPPYSKIPGTTVNAQPALGLQFTF
jgi:hypothetical protein